MYSHYYRCLNRGTGIVSPILRQCNGNRADFAANRTEFRRIALQQRVAGRNPSSRQAANSRATHDGESPLIPPEPASPRVWFTLPESSGRRIVWPNDLSGHSTLFDVTSRAQNRLTPRHPSRTTSSAARHPISQHTRARPIRWRGGGTGFWRCGCRGGHRGRRGIGSRSLCL